MLNKLIQSVNNTFHIENGIGGVLPTPLPKNGFLKKGKHSDNDRSIEYMILVIIRMLFSIQPTGFLLKI